MTSYGEAGVDLGGAERHVEAIAQPVTSTWTSNVVGDFGGFAAGRLTALEEMGFGLAIAVLIDATIVRSILVPSAMKLLGDRNWYLPRWLQWLPKLDVEGHGAAEAEPVRVPEVQPVGARKDG